MVEMTTWSEAKAEKVIDKTMPDLMKAQGIESMPPPTIVLIIAKTIPQVPRPPSWTSLKFTSEFFLWTLCKSSNLSRYFRSLDI